VQLARFHDSASQRFTNFRQQHELSDIRRIDIDQKGDCATRVLINIDQTAAMAAVPEPHNREIG
jgi:hypothetical protein